MSNLENNLLILNVLKKEIEKNPNMRFQQLLYYLRIIEKTYNIDTDKVEIDDKFYEASQITYKNLIKTIDMNEIDHLEDIYKHCHKNKNELKENEKCLCIYCNAEFTSNMIKEWVDNGETAICPNCGIDSVINKKLIKNKKILDKLYKKYFE